jgi:hypothetical protein
MKPTIMLAEGLFDGTLGKTLLVGIGAVVALVVALLGRMGYQKVQDIKRKIP